MNWGHSCSSQPRTQLLPFGASLQKNRSLSYRERRITDGHLIFSEIRLGSYSYVANVGLIIPGVPVNSQKTDSAPGIDLNKQDEHQKSETRTRAIKKRGPKSLKEREPRILDRIYELARKGLTEAQIAENVGITDRTLGRWKLSDLVFASVLKENKEIPDRIVESTLFKRATGYDYTEEQATREGVVELRRHAPPDPTSMIFWLKNRRSKEWRDRQEIDHKLIRTLEFDTGTAITKI
jgi:hypothetical protein